MPRSRRRVWLFRSLALLLPLVLLLAVEMGLRLAGYGFDPSFFRAAREGGREVWVENRDFPRRFFPPGLARHPPTLSFAAGKAANTTRVFLFGESAALGDPAPAYGPGRALEVLLEARFPSRRFEVVPLAFAAISSTVLREIARDAADKQADLWVVYMGNNEVVGPYGAGTVLTDTTPPTWLVRLGLWARGTRLGQLLESLRWRLWPATDLPRRWAGLEMFLKHQISSDDPGLEVVRKRFESNLGDILSRGTEAGARVVVSTVTVNLADAAPFASRHAEGLSSQDQARFADAYARGVSDEADDRHAEALAAFEEARAIDDRHAELRWRIGRALLALGRTAEARPELEAARDLDTLRFRADGHINDAIRRVARARSAAGVVLVDAEARLDGDEGAPPGRTLFFDHVHLRFEGSYRLARLLAEGVARELVGGAVQDPTPWLSQAECARQLALTDADRLGIVEDMVRRLDLPPFCAQSGHEARRRLLLEERDLLRARLLDGGWDEAQRTYETALRLRPRDWMLRERHALFLAARGQPARAADAWRAVQDLVPHYTWAGIAHGAALLEAGQAVEAERVLSAIASRHEDSADARNAHGLALEALGRMDEARARYREALALDPDLREASFNLAELEVALGREAEAKTVYEAMLARDSQDTDALVNLGRLEARREAWDEALERYEAALAREPRHALAHYNLGNAKLALGEEGALAHFRIAVEERPDLFEARVNLGVLLTRAGADAEAVPHLLEAARLRPADAEVRVTLGAALARLERFQEAALHLEEALRLAPGHAAASAFLAQVRKALADRR